MVERFEFQIKIIRKPIICIKTGVITYKKVQKMEIVRVLDYSKMK